MTLAKYFGPHRYARPLRRMRALKRYDLPRIEAEEAAKSLGLDPVTARSHLDAALRSIGIAPYDDLNGTDAIH